MANPIGTVLRSQHHHVKTPAEDEQLRGSDSAPGTMSLPIETSAPRRSKN
jgi:hypothetical protein